jgi:hypothetical protein
MKSQNNNTQFAIFKLRYNYEALGLAFLFCLIGIVFAVFYDVYIWVLINFLIWFFTLYDDVRTTAKICLNEVILKLTYRPFYKPLIYKYNLSEIELISVYYHWRKYSITTLFIKFKDDPIIIKHLTAMSVKQSKKFVDGFKAANVKVIELDSSEIEDSYITLP